MGVHTRSSAQLSLQNSEVEIAGSSKLALKGRVFKPDHHQPKCAVKEEQIRAARFLITPLRANLRSHRDYYHPDTDVEVPTAFHIWSRPGGLPPPVVLWPVVWFSSKL